MERFNVPIPPDDDFPQVICAQRRGEDFQTECVEYVPRWKVDGFMVVDKGAFFELADMAGGLERMLGNAEAENAKLRELVSDLMPIVCEGCHERLCDMPKEEHPFVECLFDCRIRDLGIEVGE